MFTLLLALALPPSFHTWYTAHICSELPQFECAGWQQPEQARRCEEDSPFSCVALTHTSTKYPFVGTFDGAGLVTLVVLGPKGPKKVWER